MVLKWIREFLIDLKETSGLYTIYSIFDNDAHGIVSKRGWEILSDEEELKKYLNK